MDVSSITKLLKPAIIGGAVMGLSACMYPGGNYGDGYVNGASSYNCDPYAPFDDYYACDDGYGYANIGFGGGWYDNFYYPGYGTYIFDRRGTRFGMRQQHRRYWARQRADYGSEYGRNRHGYRHGNGNWDKDDARGTRGRDLTPEQRAIRQERRAERRAQNGNTGNDDARNYRQGRSGNRSGETVRGGNRQPAVNAPTRRGRPTMAQQQPQPVAVPRQPQRRAAPPVARPAPRVTPRVTRNSKEINRRDVHDE